MDATFQQREPRPALEEIFEPWELEGRSRRDCVSHRAGFLVPLAYLCLCLGGLSLVFPAIALFALLSCIGGDCSGLILLACPAVVLLGFPLSFIARQMARRDLDLIFLGKMDHRGYALTEKARSNSHAAVKLYLLGIAVWSALAFGIFLLVLGLSR
jgi:hypothetical protein